MSRSRSEVEIEVEVVASVPVLSRLYEAVVRENLSAISLIVASRSWVRDRVRQNTRTYWINFCQVLGDIWQSGRIDRKTPGLNLCDITLRCRYSSNRGPASLSICSGIRLGSPVRGTVGTCGAEAGAGAGAVAGVATLAEIFALEAVVLDKTGAFNMAP